MDYLKNFKKLFLIIDKKKTDEKKNDEKKADEKKEKIYVKILKIIFFYFSYIN